MPAGVLDDQTRYQDECNARVGQVLDDAAIWDIVRLFERCGMTPEAYQQLPTGTRGRSRRPRSELLTTA